METRGKGRPPKYKDEYSEQAKRLCHLGLTDAQLAFFFEVSETTINNWKKRFPKFQKALQEGKVIADANVAHALYKRATGYTEVEQKLVVTSDGPRVVELLKVIPSNVTAAKFWLKNRQPAYWKDNAEPPAQPDQQPGPTEEELDALYEESMKKSKAKADQVIERIRSGSFSVATNEPGEGTN